MQDLKQLTFSIEIKEIVAIIRERFMFTDDSTVIKFGFAFAIKNYRDQITVDNDIDSLQSTRGLSYSVSTFSDSEILDSIEILYPDCNTPYRFFRTAACFGLKKIKEKMESDSKLELYDLM